MSSQASYSEKFNAEDAEVVYESSDQVRFRIHSVYLKAHTEALQPSDLVVDGVTQLSEPASVLEILFTFIYPMRQPDLLAEFESDFLKNVTEAAEKYQVFPAMYSCFLQMKESLSSHIVEVLAYALKHDYDSLANQAAAMALDYPLPDILLKIPSEYHSQWIFYYHGWLQAQKRALTQHLPTNTPIEVIKIVAGSLYALHNYEETLKSYRSWQSVIKNDLAQHPELIQFLSPRPPSRNHVLDQGGDLIIECSDEIRARVERSILVACAPGFLQFVSQSNVVCIPESSSVILRLLSFIRPTRCADLSQLEFNELKELAEVAEKYKAYQVMGLCKFFIKKVVPSNAEEIFVYAARFSYYDILDLVAPQAIHFSVDQVVLKLPGVLFQPWIQYLQQWQNIAYTAASSLVEKGSDLYGYNNYYGRRKGTCDCGNPFMVHSQPIIMKLFESPHWLTKLDELLPVGSACGGAACAEVLKSFRELVSNKIQEIRAPSTFIADSKRD